MQIQLKQAEIVEALKQYITGKGINLTGKAFTVSFTAGRKEAGLSADVGIEDADIPGVDNFTSTDDDEPAKPALSVVPAIVAAIATPETEKARTEPIAEAAATDAAKPATASLFG